MAYNVPTLSIPHGTIYGNRQHYRMGERPCNSCRIAENNYRRQLLWSKRQHLDKHDARCYRCGYFMCVRTGCLNPAHD
jgi:hypothetical protein